jgi:hypothetical protein
MKVITFSDKDLNKLLEEFLEANVELFDALAELERLEAVYVEFTD